MSAIALYCYVGVLGWLPDFLPFHMERALMACFYICSGILLSGFLKMARTRLVSAIYALLSWLFFGLMFWRLYDLGIDGAFLNLTIYAHHCILVLACSFAGILATVFVSQLIGRQRGLEWLGRNSLVIMCVHFPFAQVLNVKISQMAWYNSITGKVLFGLIEYAVVTGISVVLAILCKRYIPRITGYKPLICVDKRYAQS